MCGIAGGISTTLVGQEITNIKTLMLLSCLRGMYGAGSMIVHRKGKNNGLALSVHKTLLCAAELAYENEFVEPARMQPKIIVSHARAPTRGDNSLDNIHPHKAGNLVGVHNGTMDTIMGKSIPTGESDSKHLFMALSEHGVEDFIKECKGAYSLVWIDKAKQTLNFLRNKERPMVFAEQGSANHIGTMYFSSEKGMLQYMYSRTNISASSVNFSSPAPYMHVVFDVNTTGSIVPKEVTQYEEPKTKSYSWGDYGCGHGFDEINETGAETYTARAAPKKTTPPVTPTHSNRSVVPFNGPYKYSGGARSDIRQLPKVEETLGRRGPVAPETFHPESKSHTGSPAAMLIRSGCCVICDNRPHIEADGTCPPVHEIKLGGGYPQYICQECVDNGSHVASSILAAIASSSTKH